MQTEAVAPALRSGALAGAVIRPTFLFVVAYALNVTPHEAVHALVSYHLGLGSTLYQMWVDPNAAFATPRQLATIAAAGPIFSLAVGLFSLLLYRRYKIRPAGLFCLMMALVGVYSFLGPLAGARFGGDFNTALKFIGAPQPIELGITVLGMVLLPIFMFFMGVELSSWAPASFGTVKKVLCTTVAPWLVGPLLIVLIYWPLPKFLIVSAFSGSLFWVFAVIGGLVGTSKTRPHLASSLTWADASTAVFAVVMVRVLAHGIRLVP